jgi:hypothetical protein
MCVIHGIRLDFRGGKELFFDIVGSSGIIVHTHVVTAQYKNDSL